MRLLALLISALVAMSPAAHADAPGIEATLRPSTGTLRAVYITRNAMLTPGDPASGLMTGLVHDLTRAAALKLNVPYKVSGLPTVASIVASLNSGEADIAFMAYSLPRTADVDFSQSYAKVRYVFMVRADAPFKTSDELDQPGRKVGVATRDPADFYLTRTLDQAKLLRNESGAHDVAVRMLLSGEIDGYGASRHRLTPLVATTPGTKLLGDDFYTVEQAIAVAKGKAAHLEFVDRLIDDVRASGLIGKTIAGAGLIGVDVALPAMGRMRD